MEQSYYFLDSGFGRKLEQFGPYRLIRPCSQAIWRPRLDAKEWNQAIGEFSREGKLSWQTKKSLPESWQIEVLGLKFNLFASSFGHLGVFPEHAYLWQWIEKNLARAKKSHQNISVLNLFAYTGGATLACARQGASVCHVDASKGMVEHARKNAQLNQLDKKPIRWIVEDVLKFLKREYKRKHKYDAIILDPPSFGRGNKGEVFKIETQIRQLLESIVVLLSDKPLFIIFSCHTPGFTPRVLHNMMLEFVPKEGIIEAEEMLIETYQTKIKVPFGTCMKWYAT